MKMLALKRWSGLAIAALVIGAPLAAMAQSAANATNAAAPAAAAATAGNPDATHDYSKDSVNSGDNAWMLTSSVLVLMMTIPGLALFYAGMVRKKNILATIAQSF